MMDLAFYNLKSQESANIVDSYNLHKKELSAIEYDNDFTKETLNLMDTLATQMLKKYPLYSLSFRMSFEDVKKLLDNENIAFRTGLQSKCHSAVYSAQSGNGTEYEFGIYTTGSNVYKNIPKGGSFCTKKRQGHQIQIYDEDTRTWSNSPEIENIQKLKTGTKSEKAFVQAMEDYAYVPVYAYRPETLANLIDNFSPLTNLHDALNDLGTFHMIAFSYSEDRENFFACSAMLLCPSDLNHSGCTITYDDQGYELMQFNSTFNNGEIESVFGGEKKASKDNFYKTILFTKDIDALAKLLTVMWDRSSRGKHWLTVPLSLRAYVTFPEEAPDYTVHYIEGEECLTDDEERALKNLKSAMLRQ